MESARHDQHGGAEFIQGHEHLLLGLRLRDNAHLVLDRQYFGDSCAENCLIIGQNQFEHRFSSSPLAANKIVSINHASNAARFPGIAGGFIAANHPPSALNHNFSLTPGYFRRNDDFKLSILTNFESGIAWNVKPREAEIAVDAKAISRFLW